MTIDEAIRYNAVTLNEMERQLLHHRASALRLGIEALKIIAGSRGIRSVIIAPPLPGETPEETEASYET